MDLNQFRKQSAGKRKEAERFFEKLKKLKPVNLDEQVHQLHEDAFKKIDCLTCANCCKTTGPLFTFRDIKILAKHLKLSQQEFIDKYLRIDEDNDYVLKQVPCPFLGTNHYCSVYDYRPEACRAYPHTDQTKIHTIFKETAYNVEICPAVYQIVERLKKLYPH